MARYLEEGWGGVTKNQAEAVELYRKAAEQGYAVAQDNLGNCLYSGRGCAEDKAEAFKWYKKAAEQNVANAQNMVGRYLEEGWGGVTKNQAEAVEWYRKAANNKDVTAQYNLANCLLFGHGCDSDAEEAVKWYRKGAERGDEHAKIAIVRLALKNGSLKHEDNYSINNLGPIFEIAKGGNEYAQYIIADKLYYGKDCLVNREEAIKWYELAAEKGHEDARKKLKNLSIEVQDYSEANQDKNTSNELTNLRKIAEQGDVVAQNDLGNCLYYGRGCDKNLYEAVEWYRRAAEQGYDKAQNNLAQCLENGEGCEKDLQGALEWYKMAAEQGNRNAESGIDRIENPFDRSHQFSTSTQVAAQSSGCLLPILITLVVITLMISF